MDADLKKDIQDHFHGEYFDAARAGKKGFFKFMDRINDKFEAFANNIGFNAPGLSIVGALALGVVSTPAAMIAIGIWTINYTEQVVTSILDHATARKAIDRDIDNGTLAGRYNDVIDSKIEGLKGKIELFTAQKSQLPASGTATAAFTAALAAPANENEAPAPVAKPQPAPKL